MPQYNIKQVKGSTQGSVLFLSPNGSISENNLQLFWSSTQSSLSIGTSSATSKLSVVAQSNIPALSLGTSVASDVIMYFYTNNSTNNRAKIYVDNTLQTFNLYTQNNDTIFWNGNELAQTKTLTLFTDTSAKFENNLQVAGNLLVNGSFSVLGSASVINTQNLTIQDPIILLASTQSGTPTLDSGFFINRGTGATQAFIWDESDSKFVFIQTNDASNAIGNVNINTGAQIRALRYNFFDSGSPAAAASATINAPSGGSIALNAAASVQFITPQLVSSNQVTSWDIGANTLEFGGSNTRSFKLGIADGGSGIPTFMFYSTSDGSSGTSRTGMSFSHVIGSQLNNVLERGFVIETRDGGTYSGTAVGLTIDVTGVTNSNRFKYGLRIIDGKQSNGYVLVSDVNGFSSWTSSSVILASANGVTGSGTTNYVPKWSSVNSLGDSIITSGVNNVGVNVINPSATLDILGGTQNNYPLKLSSTNNTLSRLQHLNLGSVQTDVQVGVNNGSNSIYLGVLGSSVPYLDNRTGQSFTYQVSGVTKLSIDNNGNVGFDLGRGLVYNSGVVFTTDTFNGSSLIIGRGATGTNQAGESYIALGNSAHSTELGIAIGSSADVRENTLDGIAIGRASLVSDGLTCGIAIGRNANARHNNAWAIGYNAITTQDNEFNFGASGTLHKYTFNGQVGIGTASSTVGLHIVATQAGAGFRLVDTTEGVGRVLVSDINGVGTWASSSSIFNKDASGGYVGLTLFKINFKNVANTFTSFFTNTNTAARTYTFQDRNGTIADDTDLALKAPIASPTFTGTATTPAFNLSGQTASTVPYLDASKNLVSSAVTPTQLGYLDATSSIQTQLNAKLSSTKERLLTICGFAITNPADATSYYFSEYTDAVPQTSQGIYKFQFNENLTVTRVLITVKHNTNPTNESVSFYLRASSTTDQTITTSMDMSTVGPFNTKVFVYSGLSLSVTSGTDYEIKMLTPTWATNPTSTTIRVKIYGY